MYSSMDSVAVIRAMYRETVRPGTGREAGLDQARVATFALPCASRHPDFLSIVAGGMDDMHCVHVSHEGRISVATCRATAPSRIIYRIWPVRNWCDKFSVGVTMATGSRDRYLA